MAFKPILLSSAEVVHQPISFLPARSIHLSDSLKPPIRLGFKMISDQPALGLMQTEWKENRVGIPTGWIASLLGKLYESELMDSYRIRMEFDEEQSISRIFIAHRGMREVSEGESSGDLIVEAGAKTQWIPRASDPELEIEMLMRFMAGPALETRRWSRRSPNPRRWSGASPGRC